MAITGSLNFLSASLTGSDNINIDFVGLNTLMVDPVNNTSSILGHAIDAHAGEYPNDEIETMSTYNAVAIIDFADPTGGSDDYASATGESITIISTDGTSRTYTSNSSATNASAGTFEGDHAGEAVKARSGLKSCIEHSNGHGGKISVETLGSTAGTSPYALVLTQLIPGKAGRTIITSDINNTTITDFAFYGGEPNQLNSLLLHRNGPYQHPSWKQLRGGDHPVARALRLGNTMSVEINWPDPVHKESYRQSKRGEKENYNLLEYDDYIREENERLARIGAYANSLLPNLHQYYEPVITTKHKPLVYDTTLGPRTIKVRASLMNQMTDFSSDALNEILKFASGDPVVGISQNIKYKRTNQKFYNIIRMANKYGATSFMYTERIYPREMNSHKKYNTIRPNYEEAPGTGSNGYDRALHRLFWKGAQGGAGSTAITSSTPSDGTTRLRTGNSVHITAGSGAFNSMDVLQSMDFSRHSIPPGTTAPEFSLLTSSALVGTSSAGSAHTASLAGGLLNLMVQSVNNGVVVNRYHLIHTTGVIDQLDAYQPYPMALLSSWPLDVREDIYDKPHYLTSSLGGKGLQIGLTPHKGGNIDMWDASAGPAPHLHGGYITSSTGRFDPALVLYDRVQSASIDDVSAPPGGNAFNRGPGGSSGPPFSVESVTGALGNLHTGSAGELVYSTKPTIFYADYRRRDDVEVTSTSHNFTHQQGPNEAVDLRIISGGYTHPTASLQYNRHTFPYNTPFYATNKIRDRNPFYDSYDDFAEGLNYLGRDYSIVPEYRYSDHMDYYHEAYKTVLSTPSKPLFSKQPHTEVHLPTKLARAVHFVRLHNNEDLADIHKANFLMIDGADISSSAGTENYSKSTNRYGYSDLSGAAITTTVGDSIYTYKSDETSVAFYNKYAITDSTINFSHLLNAEVFTNGTNTIPEVIKFKCDVFKKFLPYNGFYPVLRTVQIGNTFKEEMSTADGFSGSMTNVPAGYDEQSRLQANLQALLEPFMAPGLLYNSIKSGIAVDYPIYSDVMHYYAPRAFVSQSAHDQVKTEHAEKGYSAPIGIGGVTHQAISSSYHGGLYMMGASRCIPSILTSVPDKRLPFKTLYDWQKMHDIFAVPISGTTKPRSMHLVSDFVDLNRFNSVQAPTTNPHAGTGSMSGSIIHGNPFVYLPNEQGMLALKAGQYFPMINNYLSETMEFFLTDLDNTPGQTKLPIILTDPTTTVTVQAKDYLMEVSLRMGTQQVMCEGPRFAGIGVAGLYKESQQVFAQAGAGEGFFLKNASMRGYIYGPPIEIISHLDGGTTWNPNTDTIRNKIGAIGEADEADYIAGTSSFAGDITDPSDDATTGARAADADYASYFAANLQDPAYHAYTPPYFYGKSSVVYKLSAPSSPEDQSLFTILNTMQHSRQQGSYQINKYDPPTFTNTFPGNLYRVDSTSLSLIKPTTYSVSNGAAAKMKIDASIPQHFSDPIKVGTGIQSQLEQETHVWYIAPEWICPVLDFSSSATAVKDLKGNISTITNSFHDITTGRGLWGGYGADPYNWSGQTTKFGHDQKGLYLEIGDFSLHATEDSTKLDMGREEDISGYYDFLDLDPSENTGSLSNLLGMRAARHDTERYPIGKVANTKTVHEAIVLIPYVDAPINLPLLPAVAYAHQHIKSTVSHDNSTYYATREIIPGKHFLPINEEVFVNLLHFHLLEATDQIKGDKKLWGAEDDDPEVLLKWQAIRQGLSETDVGKMIKSLSSFETSTTGAPNGFQLPPEFDFIHNAAVPPFQMMVIPFDHELQKQELIDIYQGIMPESSLKATKKTKTFEVHPTRIPIGDLAPNLEAEPRTAYLPQLTLGDKTFPMAQTNLDRAALVNFLSPHSFIQNPLPNFVDKANGNNNYSTAGSFYKNLRFMVFKVKQRAKKDYSNYRKSQIIKAVQARLSVDAQGATYQKITDSEFIKVIQNKTVGDVFGANWPYDYFSLIQLMKLDITFSAK